MWPANVFILSFFRKNPTGQTALARFEKAQSSIIHREQFPGCFDPFNWIRSRGFSATNIQSALYHPVEKVSQEALRIIQWSLFASRPLCAKDTTPLSSPVTDPSKLCVFLAANTVHVCVIAVIGKSPTLLLPLNICA